MLLVASKRVLALIDCVVSAFLHLMKFILRLIVRETPSIDMYFYKYDVSLQFDEYNFILCTKDTHMQHCQSIEDADNPDDVSKEFGVNRHSSLLELCHFEMCSGSLIPHVMHDLLEGALQHILKQLLHVLIDEKKYFTLAHLNSKVVGMELGYMEDNRPSPLARGDKTLRQNGTVIVIVCIHAFTQASQVIE